MHLSASIAIETVHARVVESKQAQAPQMVQATGALHARESATLSAQVMGRVQQVLVREGDSVRPGQTLVVLDDATLKSSSEQAEAAVMAAENQQIAAQTNADLAASTLARYKQLQAQKSVSAQEMDEVTRKAEAAAAQVDALRAQTNAMKAQKSGARTMLSYSRVDSPFAGVITARMVDPGALAVSRRTPSATGRVRSSTTSRCGCRIRNRIRAKRHETRGVSEQRSRCGHCRNRVRDRSCRGSIES